MLLSKKRGDRSDGYRVTNVPLFFQIVPYVMKTRVDSQNYFADEVDVTNAEQFVRDHQEDIPGLKLFHIFIAAAVRTYSQRPYLNRFVKNSRIYARKDIPVSLAIKRVATAKGDETVVKPVFEPSATLKDIVKYFDELITANKTVVKENGTDSVAKLYGALPHGLVKALIDFINWTDNHNIMAKKLIEISPFHTGIFLTNVGSIGIEPIYHHLYEFGTTSEFIAVGKKHVQIVCDDEGNEQKRKTMGIKIVTDERICDGQYFAESCKMLMNYVKKPEKLLAEPEFVYVDDGINKLFDRFVIDKETGKKTDKKFELGDKYKFH